MTPVTPAAIGFKSRFKAIGSSRQHMDHVCTLLLLTLVQTAFVVGLTHTAMDLTFIFGLAGREFVMLFYAVESLLG